MGKNQSASNLPNIVLYDTNGNLSFVSGSTTLLSVSSSGALTTNSTITARTLVVQTITSSTDFITGSARFGTTSANTFQFTGSVYITGSLQVTGSQSLFNGGIGANFNTYPVSVANNRVLVFNSPVAQQPARMWSGGIFADTSENIVLGSYNNISFLTNQTNTNALFLSASGQVGIGTNSPANYGGWGGLDVRGGNGGHIIVANSSGTNRGEILTDGNGFNISAFTNNNIAFKTNNTFRAFITNSGLQLDNGELNTPKALWFQANSNTGGNLGTIDWYNVQWDGAIRAQIKGETDTGLANGRLVFSTGGGGVTERMRINTGGQVLINTASSLYPNVKLCVKQTLGERTMDIWSNWSGDQATTALSIIKFDNVSTTAQVFQRFVIDNGNVASGQINANGANAAAFGSWSDIRLKENITNLPSQLSNIMALRPVEFDYKDGSGHQIGFIAQEIQEVYPDVVGEDPEGFLTVTGWSKTEARLIKAIQELKAEIDELKNNK